MRITLHPETRAEEKLIRERAEGDYGMWVVSTDHITAAAKAWVKENPVPKTGSLLRRNYDRTVQIVGRDGELRDPGGFLCASAGSWEVGDGSGQYTVLFDIEGAG